MRGDAPPPPLNGRAQGTFGPNFQRIGPTERPLTADFCNKIGQQQTSSSCQLQKSEMVELGSCGDAMACDRLCDQAPPLRCPLSVAPDLISVDPIKREVSAVPPSCHDYFVGGDG